MDTESFVLGVALGGVALFFTGFLKKAGEDCYSLIKKRISPESSKSGSSHLVIHTNNVAVSNTGQDESFAKTGQVSSITYLEIKKAINDAPPLQRESVAERYLGIRVAWDTFYLGAQMKDSNEIRLHLIAADVEIGTGSIFCTVPYAEYREIGILQENSKIRVYGEVEASGDNGIRLKDARLHINAPPKEVS